MRRGILVSLLVVGAAALLSADSLFSFQSKSANPSQDGDRAAIQKSAADFAEAFNKRDAKAIAAMHTEQAEVREHGGRIFVGKPEIERAYAAYFAANPEVKNEVMVKSIRFPAKDLAVEEGLIRQARGSKELPVTSAYSAIHVRENGQWKIALSNEDVPRDRLENLDWLLGEWTTKVKDDTVSVKFARDPKKAVLNATFARTPAGKDAITGTIRVMLDPETGQLRSWGFEDDGAHSQSLWHCDGKSWILDTRGVQADGTPTAERIILQRVGADAMTWRAVDRVVGETHLPDTTPMRLTRSAMPK